MTDSFEPPENAPKYVPSIRLDISPTGAVTRIIVMYDPTVEWATVLPEDGLNISGVEPFKQYPWKVLDEISSRFGNSLVSFEVVAFTYTAMMSAAVEIIEPMLPLMSASGKLSFWCRSPHDVSTGVVVDDATSWGRSRLSLPPRTTEEVNYTVDH